jgi:stage II sporulation protein D
MGEWKMRRFAALCAFMLIFASGAQSAVIPDEARVRILSSRHPGAAVITSDNARIYVSEGIFVCPKAEFRASRNGVEIRALGRRFYSGLCVYKTSGTFTVSIENGGKKIERTYPGSAEISCEGRELCVVNILPFEDFVHNAACSESGELLNLPPAQRDAFLSAMEICVRSYLAAEKSRHGGSYQFCDLTHCVHYEGIFPFGKKLTEGEILEGSGGSAVRAYFHSACGGVLAGPEVFWERASPDSFYRRGNDSDGGAVLCARSPHASWNYFIKDESLNSVFGGGVSSLKTVEKEGRVTAFLYNADGAEKTYPISRFMSEAGRRFGWNAVKSNLFTVRKKDGGWLFEGRGLGHGTGLCQYGAQELAKKGWSAERILSFYFPGAKIVKAEHK